MKKRLYVFSILCLIGFGNIINAQAPNYLWSKSVGSVGNALVSAIAIDGNGNSYITGSYVNTISFGIFTLQTLGSGIYIVKYDINGNVIWAKTSSGNDASSTAIALDGDGNVYVTGGFYGPSFSFGPLLTLTNSDSSATYQDAFVIKLNTNGDLIWGNKYVATLADNDYINGIAVDGNGSSYITGSFYDTITLSRNFFIGKLNQLGDIIWFRSAGGTGFDKGQEIAVDGSGNICVEGTYTSPSISFDSTTLTNLGGSDLFTVKYDTSGNLLWAKSAGGTSSSVADGIDTDGNNNSYVMGYFNGPSISFGSIVLTNPNASLYAMFLVKYDANGTVVWAICPTGGGPGYGGAISVDTFGNSYIAGTFSSSNIVFGSTTLTNAGSNDFFIAKYTSSGTVDWAKSSGGSADDFSRGISLSPTGNCYVVGNFNSSSITFGSSTLYNDNPISTYDMFITKLDNATLSNSSEAYSNENAIKLFPNPAKNYFELSTNQLIEKIEIYSMLGQLVKIFPAQNQYDTSNLSKGNYIVKINTNTTFESKILVVE
ncbi:SBBP repeat-containing protein [Flavobacterium paronense]|uniref:SBBP repeat-containing protein n=1 Tax=Flavobacterium paronense TaxID=1392775 RepID=A0ABV5GIZ6_9FLAO|nr:SBBP repeat-containing protein [Flavobacterium paronense]MDN3676439.1 SBBP repeat-containing protein [Flavobacterium paronense]